MANNTGKIISASRRTDLPAFHYSWLQKVLAEKMAIVSNPRFPEKSTMVDLSPDAVHTIVLWSKDFSKVYADPMNLDNYNLFFQYTINNYSTALEPNIPDYKQTLKVLEGMLRRYKPEQFNIRFDPIIISLKGEWQPDAHKPGLPRLKTFEQLCQDLTTLGMTDSRITTSYLALYPYVRKRFQTSDLGMVELADNIRQSFFKRMAEIAAKYHIDLYACASPELTVSGLKESRCIDADHLEYIFGGKLSKAKDTGQRPACRCHKSIDIGDYNHVCAGGCLYCYANKK